MLPVVSEETRVQLLELFQAPTQEWKKDMIHRLKEDNPEVNSLLLAMAEGSEDPKGVVLAGYAVYYALEQAQKEEDAFGISEASLGL